MAERLDYTEVHPENRWKILRAQWRFALWALYTSIGSINFGFDLTAGLLMVAIGPFQKQYGVPYNSVLGDYLIPARWQAGWNAAACGGDGVGCFVAIFLLNRIGRKPVIWIGCVFSVVGIGLQQASHEWKLFLVGRLINGIGFGMVYTFSPVWIGELARPELRGFFLVLQNGSIALGQLIIVLAARGAETLTTEWSYKTMMVIQYALPAILLFFSYWFPESAYFLIKKGKIEAAEKALKQTYGSHNQEFLDIEMKRLTENVRFSEELLKEAAIGGPVLYQCFRGTNLRRTLTAILMITAPQFMGAFFYDGYVTYFLELIGITQAFDVTVAVFVVNLGATFLAFGLIEVLGRRALIIPGSLAITVTCLVIGICGSFPLTNKAAQWVIVVGEFFWIFFEQATIGPVGVALGAEVGSLPLRTGVQGLMGVTQTTMGWVISFVVPYIINPDAGNLGAKISYMFFGMSLIISIILFLYTPETKGLSYEELDYLFSTRTNSRKFQQVIKTYRAEHPAGSETISETVSPDEKAVAYDSQA